MTSVPIKLRTGRQFLEEDELGIAEPVIDHSDPIYHRIGFGSGGVSPRFYPGVDKFGNMRMSFGTTIRSEYPGAPDSIFGFEGDNFVVRKNGITLVRINNLGISVNGAINQTNAPSAFISGDSGLSELLFPLFSDKTFILQLNRPVAAAINSKNQFTAYRDLPSFFFDFGASFTRSGAGIATFINAFGNYVQAAPNQPRITYNPVSRKCRGLLIEKASANLLTNSYDLTQWTSTGQSINKETLLTWSAKGLNFPFNFTESAANTEHSFTKAIVGDITLPFSCSHFFQAKTFTGIRRFALFLTNSDRSHLFGINVNVDTDGTLSFVSNRTVGNGSVSSYEFDNLGKGFYRLKVTGVVNASGISGNTSNLSLVFASLGDNNTNTNLVFTPNNGIGNWCLINDFQVEQGPIATSYLATNTVVSYREADYLKLDLSKFVYTNSEGTFEIKFRIPNSIALNAIIFSLQDSTGNTRIDYYISNVDTLNNLYTVSSKTYVNNISGAATIVSSTVSIAKSSLTINYSNLNTAIGYLVINGTSGFTGTINLISYE